MWNPDFARNGGARVGHNWTPNEILRVRVLYQHKSYNRKMKCYQYFSVQDIARFALQGRHTLAGVRAEIYNQQRLGKIKKGIGNFGIRKKGPGQEYLGLDKMYETLMRKGLV